MMELKKPESVQEAAKQQLAVWEAMQRKEIVKGTRGDFITNETAWRTASLHPDYHYGTVPSHGTGSYSVHNTTGRICECKMEWHENSRVLICLVCFLEGT